MNFQNASLFPYTTEVTSRGTLTLGGCDVMEIAYQYGTPLYVYDEHTLRMKCREFISAFRARYPNTNVIYACKAFINPAIANLLNEEGLGLDVVSGGELAVAEAVGFPAANVYFHGNNKSHNELSMALDYGIGRIVVDNFHELELLQDTASSKNMVQDILLRISPGIDPHTHAYTTTGVLDSKFGFPIQTGQARQAFEKAQSNHNVRVIGLHFHLGSPVFELTPYTKAMEITLNFARDVGIEVTEISPGGGFAVSYTKDQSPPSLEEYADAIASTLDPNDGPRLVIEPGRAIVGQAGVALYTVGGSKNIPGIRKYVSIDGGMGDNIRPALYEAEYAGVVANKMFDEHLETVSIAGKFCESGDVLIRDIAFPQLDPGDILAVPTSGAYAPSMASNYNLVPRPAIIMVSNGQARLIRRRETYGDLIRNDIFDLF